MARRNIYLKGDWRKLRHKFDRMSDLGQFMADRVLYSVAQQVRDELHQVVNSAPPPPNAPATEKKKGFNYPLRETGGMSQDDSVVITPVKLKDRTAYVVQGNPGKLHERTGKSYQDILTILEEGDGRLIPARHAMEITYDRTKGLVERYAIKSAKEYISK